MKITKHLLIIAFAIFNLSAFGHKMEVKKEISTTPHTSEIALNNVNLSVGSVMVYQGDKVLLENTDYTVDYKLGRVRIINPAVATSTEVIRINVQSRSPQLGIAPYKLKKEPLLWDLEQIIK